MLTISEIKEEYCKHVDHEVAISTIYRMLARHGWRQIMPRSKLPKKASDQDIDAYKKITEKLFELSNFYCNKTGLTLRLMFQDEAGFGRINKPKNCWCSKGIRPVVPCHRIREYTYAYGAISPLDGEMASLVLPYANTACMNIFLKEVSKRYSNNYILMVADNASWHKSKGLNIPANIEIFPLLPYTPELNPIEMIWDE